MRKSEALKIVALLRAAWPTTAFPAESAAIYATFFEDFDYVLATDAVKRLIGTRRGLHPSIGEIRSAIINDADPVPEVDLAWAEVERGMRNGGRSRPPTWSNSVVQEAVRLIGWANLCGSETIGVERAHFFKVYEILRTRELDRRNIDSLEGRVPLKVLSPAKRKKLGPVKVGEVIKTRSGAGVVPAWVPPEEET